MAQQMTLQAERQAAVEARVIVLETVLKIVASAMPEEAKGQLMAALNDLQALFREHVKTHDFSEATNFIAACLAGAVEDPADTIIRLQALH